VKFIEHIFPFRTKDLKGHIREEDDNFDPGEQLFPDPLDLYGQEDGQVLDTPKGGTEGVKQEDNVFLPQPDPPNHTEESPSNTSTGGDVPPPTCATPAFIPRRSNRTKIPSLEGVESLVNANFTTETLSELSGLVDSAHEPEKWFMNTERREEDDWMSSRCRLVPPTLAVPKHEGEAVKCEFKGLWRRAKLIEMS
jgi:hypothetical protein